MPNRTSSLPNLQTAKDDISSSSTSWQSPLTMDASDAVRYLEKELQGLKTLGTSHTKASTAWHVERLDPSEILYRMREDLRNDTTAPVGMCQSSVSAPVMDHRKDYFDGSVSRSIPGSGVATPQDIELLSLMSKAADAASSSKQEQDELCPTKEEMFRDQNTSSTMKDQIKRKKSYQLYMSHTSGLLCVAAELRHTAYALAEILEIDVDDSSVLDDATSTSRASRTPSLCSTGSSSSMSHRPNATTPARRGSRGSTSSYKRDIAQEGPSTFPSRPRMNRRAQSFASRSRAGSVVMSSKPMSELQDAPIGRDTDCSFSTGSTISEAPSELETTNFRLRCGEST